MTKKQFEEQLDKAWKSLDQPLKRSPLPTNSQYIDDWLNEVDAVPLPSKEKEVFRQTLELLDKCGVRIDIFYVIPCQSVMIKFENNWGKHTIEFFRERFITYVIKCGFFNIKAFDLECGNCIKVLTKYLTPDNTEFDKLFIGPTHPSLEKFMPPYYTCSPRFLDLVKRELLYIRANQKYVYKESLQKVNHFKKDVYSWEEVKSMAVTFAYLYFFKPVDSPDLPLLHFFDENNTIVSFFYDPLTLHDEYKQLLLSKVTISW